MRNVQFSIKEGETLRGQLLLRKGRPYGISPIIFIHQLTVRIF